MTTEKQQLMVGKTFTKIQLAFATAVAAVLATATKAFAQITNPALDPSVGSVGGADTTDAAGAVAGSIFASYFIMIWQFVISIGGFMVVIYFIWGAIDWIVAGGDQSKIQKGRDRMIQAVIGMILLAGSFIIVSLINDVFFKETFDILNIQF